MPQTATSSSASEENRMSTNNNKGFEVEEKLRKIFHAHKVEWDCIDFATKKTFYECKSAQIFLLVKNGGSRGGRMTSHCGRFKIDKSNHMLLRLKADEYNKHAKYVFAAMIGQNFIYKVLSWSDVDAMMRKNHPGVFTQLRFREVFKEEIR